MRGHRLPPQLGALLALSLAFASTPRPCLADPIGDFVARVSADSISHHIAALEYPRYTPTDLDRAAAYITQRLGSYGYLVVRQPVSYSDNLIARIQGSVDPDQVFVIGAHFDTVSGSPGADDNASGVAAVLEIARVLADARPAFSIEFLAFTLEELYMVGSYAYVQRAQQEGKHIIGMIDFDMIGYTCDYHGCQLAYISYPPCITVYPEGIDIGDYAATLVNVASESMLDACNHAGDTYVPDLPRVRMEVAGVGSCYSLTRRSDHVPFWDAGIPALEFFDTYGARNPYYHSQWDRLSTLNIEFCRQVTQTALAMLLEYSVSGVPLQPAERAPGALALIYPNPASSSARIRLQLAEPAPVRLAVYDVGGRRVRSLLEGRGLKGTQEAIWNRLDDANRPVPGGVYFVRLSVGPTTETRSLVLTP